MKTMTLPDSSGVLELAYTSSPVRCAHIFLTLCTMKTLQQCESSHENWQMLQIKTMEAAGRREGRRVIRTPLPGTWWVHKDGTS